MSVCSRTDLREVVESFINERSQFVDALKNCTGENDADYFRWTGGAEARRQLAERLGWTTPHELADRTSPRLLNAESADRSESGLPVDRAEGRPTARFIPAGILASIECGTNTRLFIQGVDAVHSLIDELQDVVRKMAAAQRLLDAEAESKP